MALDNQKNFYDEKRYFQGKDNPGEAHPDAKTREPMPRGQIIVGVLFLAFVAAMALLNIRSANKQLVPIQAAPPAAAPATGPIPATK
jgi:hypothetical protein